MSTKRRGLLYIPGAAGGSLAITSTPGAIGVGTAPHAVLLLKKVVSTTAPTGIGSAAGVVLRSRQVPTFPSTGIGSSTGESKVFVNLTTSHVPLSRGQGLAVGALAMMVNITATVATTGRGSSTGVVSRTRIIGAAGIQAGIRGTGTATGLLYPINNISDVITAAAPFVGRGTSTGAIRRTIRVSGAATGTGNSGTTTKLSRKRQVVPTVTTGQGSSTGAIRRTLRVGGAATGIGSVNGTAIVSGLIQILAASLVASKGVGTSTGAIRRTIRAVPAAGVRGIGSSVGAVVEHVEKRLLAGNLVAPTGIGSATGDVDRRLHVGAEVPLSTGIGTAATVVAGAGLNVFVRITATTATTGIGTSTGAIRRTIPFVTLVTPSGIGYAFGTATKGGLKQITSTPVVTGIGTSAASSTAIRFKKQLPNAAAIGIGYAVGVALANGTAFTVWAPAFSPGYITQFNPEWFHPLTVHTHAVLLNTTGTAEARLRYKDVGALAATEANWTVVTGSIVTLTTNTEVTEVESSALTLPAGTKDYRTEVRHVGGDSTKVWRARLAHQGS